MISKQHALQTHCLYLHLKTLAWLCIISLWSEHSPVLNECTFIIAVTIFTMQLVHANPHVGTLRAIAQRRVAHTTMEALDVIIQS